MAQEHTYIHGCLSVLMAQKADRPSAVSSRHHLARVVRWCQRMVSSAIYDLSIIVHLQQADTASRLWPANPESAAVCVQIASCLERNMKAVQQSWP
jgi:hypothetical protein